MWPRFALLGCIVFRAFAQDAISHVTPETWTSELNGVWRWHPGDDMQWASPTFDDSAWPRLTLPAQSPRLSQYWIRVPVRVGPVSDPGLLLGPIAFGYGVYWDGRRIGNFGKSRMSRVAVTAAWSLFHVPAELAVPGVHTIAIRVSPSVSSFFRQPHIRETENCVGAFRLLKDIETGLWVSDFHVQLLESFTFGAYFLVGFFCVLLPHSIAPGSAFRWFGLSNMAAAIARCFSLLVLYYSSPVFHIGTQVLGSVAVNAAIEFAYAMYRRQVPWGVRAFELLLVCLPFCAFLPLPITIANNVPVALVGSWIAGSMLPIPLLWSEYRKGSSGAGMMTILFGFLACAFLAEWFLMPLRLLPPLHLGGYELLYPTLARFFFVPLVALQIQRLNRRTRDEQQRLHSEMEAARHVQEILLPSRNIVTPGFEIDSAYQPATEVGGDFFQLFPIAGDSLLIVIGDVSGKGLKAALFVSMIVGALRSRRSDQPSSVLIELNAVLLGQTDGGFTTCCCALFSPDGTLTIANAGHIAPYRNGEEIETTPALPLGIDPDARWPETRVLLQPGDRVLWVSDGVIEARNSRHDLLGFARTQELATQPASAIARTAQQFGQEDDITVLSITRQPVPAYIG